MICFTASARKAAPGVAFDGLDRLGFDLEQLLLPSLSGEPSRPLRSTHSSAVAKNYFLRDEQACGYGRF